MEQFLSDALFGSSCALIDKTWRSLRERGVLLLVDFFQKQRPLNQCGLSARYDIMVMAFAAYAKQQPLGRLLGWFPVPCTRKRRREPEQREARWRLL